LIFAAFVFAMGYEKTGLGRRIALVLVKWLGGRTLGLGYAIALSDLALAPFTPSNTARSAGTIFPVIVGIPGLYGSGPGESARRIGAYLMWVAFAATCVTSAMFVTALAPNLFALELVRKATGVEITWSGWFVGFLPVGGPLMLLVPWLVYKLYPPEIRTSAEVPRWAAQELAKLGGITAKETIMAALVIIALGLWIAGGNVIDATMVALVGISLMLIFAVVSWDDIAGNTVAWNVLVWFATLVVLADGLNKVGVVDWIGHGASVLLAGHSPVFVMTMLVALFFMLHYMFASLTAHATALLPVILAAGASVPGMPVRVFAMMLVFSLGLMGVLTPYATGPAPVYFASGYISRKDFWRLGLIFGLIFLGALLLAGTPYLLIIRQGG
jgi:L-tartrate/succinate antiporter